MVVKIFKNLMSNLYFVKVLKRCFHLLLLINTWSDCSTYWLGQSSLFWVLVMLQFPQAYTRFSFFNMVDNLTTFLIKYVIFRTNLRTFWTVCFLQMHLVNFCAAHKKGGVKPQIFYLKRPSFMKNVARK